MRGGGGGRGDSCVGVGRGKEGVVVETGGSVAVT